VGGGLVDFLVEIPQCVLDRTVAVVPIACNDILPLHSSLTENEIWGTVTERWVGVDAPGVEISGGKEDRDHRIPVERVERNLEECLYKPVHMRLIEDRRFELPKPKRDWRVVNVKRIDRNNCLGCRTKGRRPDGSCNIVGQGSSCSGFKRHGVRTCGDRISTQIARPSFVYSHSLPYSLTS